MIERLLADPWHVVQIVATMTAALVILSRAMRRVHAMCCCSPHALRLAAVIMAVGAVAAFLGALAGAEDYFTGGQTLLLAGIALHIVTDRRPFVRGRRVLASLESEGLAGPGDAPELQVAGYQ